MKCTIATTELNFLQWRNNRYTMKQIRTMWYFLQINHPLSCVRHTRYILTLVSWGIFCNRSSEGGLLPPPWILHMDAWYPYIYYQCIGIWTSLLSIDTKMSTSELHMTSLWRHKVSAPSQIWMYWKYTWKWAKNDFSIKKIVEHGFPLVTLYEMDIIKK